MENAKGICDHQFRSRAEEEMKEGYWSDWEDKKGRGPDEAKSGAQSWIWMELILVRSSLYGRCLKVYGGGHVGCLDQIRY